MPKGRMPQVMRQTDRLGQILIAAQAARQRAPDLRHLHAMRQPVAIVVAFGIDKDLRLIFQATKRCRVNNAVAIALIGRAIRVFRPPG